MLCICESPAVAADFAAASWSYHLAIPKLLSVPEMLNCPKLPALSAIMDEGAVPVVSVAKFINLLDFLCICSSELM